MEPVDLALLGREVVTDVRITAARRSIRMEVATPHDVVPVLADRPMLHRAFLNVVTNAVKFSHDEGTVEVVVTQVGEVAEVSVTDHGIGIPAAEIDRLGTRFFRASNAIYNEIAGTGLGLRIMQTIIDKHHGEVVIDSHEGTGTTVWVRLQVHPDGVPAPLPHELVEAEDRLAEELIARERLAITSPDGSIPAGAEASGPRIVPAFPRRS